MFISIGHACNVRFGINSYNEMHQLSQPTHFFDWLTTSFDSVIDIINCSDIDEFVNNLYIKPINSSSNENVSFTSVDHCESIHDVKKGYSETDLTNFKCKYIRRHKRLIDTLKNSSNKLFFLRYGVELNETLIDLFLSTIKNMNPQIDFALVHLCNKLDNDEDHYISENFIRINLVKFKYDNYDYSAENHEHHFHWNFNDALSFLKNI